MVTLMRELTHTPVLLEEVVEGLRVKPGGCYIDCTIGGGGHAEAILKNSMPGGQLLGIDADPEALTVAKSKLSAYANSVLLVNENFDNLQAICIKYDFLPVHGILFDLGLSTIQLDTPGRGFSFQEEGPLDMRFGPHQTITAGEIVNTYSEDELADIIRTYGEEKFSYRIARYIVHHRPIKTTLHLADAVEQAVGGRKGRIHPATRTFQALRIAVNQELESLEQVLRQAVNLLAPEGRLVVISYHSLEDRIVKRFMQHEARSCICPPGTPVCICGHIASLKLVHKKIITPTRAEIEHNRRSRSAKLRVAKRVGPQDDEYEIVERLGSSVPVNANYWKRPLLLKRLRACLEYEPALAPRRPG